MEYRTNGMFRITAQEESEVMRLRLQGRLVGPFVSELERVWQSLTSSSGSKRLCVDLCDVLYIDAAGRELLAEIYGKTGAEFVADTPLMKHFAQEVKRSSVPNRGQGG